MLPKLHLLGIFHTQHQTSYSHCAFTGKALRFPKMMQQSGYEVIEYSNEGSEGQASEYVPILSEKQFNSFFKNRKNTDFYGDAAVVGSEAHQKFEQRLIEELKKRVDVKDIICHPFGHAHQALLDIFPQNNHVETGIGYPTLMPTSFKIFESYAWMHFHQGRENRNGKNYEWVVPNYFDLNEWEPSYKPGEYLAFLGRICSIKGMDTILEIAKRSPWPVVIHGQGDPSPWTHSNIHYGGPISGKARSDFLRNARAALMPTNFTEPFAGSGVEAMLCGTPLIAVDYGAFTETIIDGVTGFRCHTLQDWIDAIDRVEELDRETIANVTRSRYSLETCGKKYDKIFKDINNLWEKGWYQLDRPLIIDYDELNKEEAPFAERLAAWIKINLKPKNVLDLGSGIGTYVNALDKIGVTSLGYDIDERVKNKPNLLCKSLFDLKHQGNVVLCLEVAEHINKESNKLIVETMEKALKPGGTLIWTAAKPGQSGVGHINCQTKEYWIDLFSSTKLKRCEKTEAKLIKYCQQGYHMGWFIQNLLIYKKDV